MSNLSFYAPISKTDKKKHMVYGYASTEAVDSQGEIVKKDALASALQDYMRFANIREMHQPSAVGKTQSANIDQKGLYIAAKIVDPLAWEKVEQGVYNGFSIGGRVKTMLDNEITNLTLSEISLVDRPANPDAVFDVWKAEGGKPEEVEVVEETSSDTPVVEVAPSDEDTEEETEKEAIEQPEIGKEETKTDEPEIKKDVHHANMVTRMASDMKTLIDAKRAAGDDTGHLETALESLKKAGAKELKHAEDYAGSADGADSAADQQAGGAYITYSEDATDVKKEEKKDPKKDLFEKVDAQMKSGKMPTEEQIDEMMKYMDIDSTDNNRSALKWELAGKLIDFISNNMVDQANGDAAKKEVEKVQAENKKPVEEVPHQWDQVKLLIKRVEAQLKKNTDGADGSKYVPNTVSTPKDAENANMSTQNSNVTQALTMLQEAVKLLNTTTISQGLTDTEEEKLTNGVQAGSERTSQGRYNEDEDLDAHDFDEERKENNTAIDENVEDDSATARVRRSDMARDLKKMEKLTSEIELLKGEIEKLKAEPMPIKARATYATIEKFEPSNADEGKTLLKKIDDTVEALKNDPNNPALQELAKSLQVEYMKSTRKG